MKIEVKGQANFLYEGWPLNTRFNPTTNGYLHVGHLYLALLNAAYATETGGKFQVRFDDKMPVWVARIGEGSLDRYADAARRDLEWCGVTVDEWVSERALQGEVQRRLRDLGHVPVRFPHPHPCLYGVPRAYPYTPLETLEKVVMDWFTSCNCLIRADDLISEFSLYYYFCQILGLAHPDMIYVPRMGKGGGEGIATAISKSAGGYAIEDYRVAGWSPREVRELVAESALIDPFREDGIWTLENLRESPQVAYRSTDLALWREDHREAD